MSVNDTKSGTHFNNTIPYLDCNLPPLRSVVHANLRSSVYPRAVVQKLAML